VQFAETWDVSTMKIILFVTLIALPLLGACQDTRQAQEDLAGIIQDMDEAERRLSEEVRRTSVPAMSLRQMFDDPNVQRLARAAGRGDVEAIDRLVAEGVDVNSRGSQSATPLYWAFRSLRGFNRLLALGAEPNAIFDDGTSIMHAAVEQEDSEFLRQLLAHGGDPNLRAGSLKEPLLFTAMLGYGLDKVELLLEAGADLEARGFDGYTPLLAGTKLNQFDAIYVLLENGADYTAETDYGRSLADLIETRRPLIEPDSERMQWLNRVSDWLRSKGVEISGQENQ